jgi:hypothetical protein
MALTEKLIKYIHQGNGMFMATRDANKKPEIHRALGAIVMNESRIKFFFDGVTARRILENITDNHLISVVTCSDTFESYQFKGKSFGFSHVTEEENQEVMDYFQKFSDLMVVFGLRDKLVYNYPHTQMMCLVMDVEDVYEQTPKVGTGQKV